MIKEMKRVRLQTLARILSGQKITLLFGREAATDLKTITLIPFEKEIVPGVPANKSECWLALKATCAHEAGHVLFTSRGLMEKAAGDRLLAVLLNIIEDSRIELAMSNAYPGTAGWFKFSNDYIFRNRKNWGTGVNALLAGLAIYATTGRVPEQIAAQEDVMQLIEECAPIIDRGRVEEDTFGAFERAREVYEEIKSYVKPGEIKASPEVRGTYGPARAPDRKTDPRRAPRLPETEKAAASSKTSVEEDETPASTGEFDDTGPPEKSEFPGDEEVGEEAPAGTDPPEPGETSEPETPDTSTGEFPEGVPEGASGTEGAPEPEAPGGDTAGEEQDAGETPGETGEGGDASGEDDLKPDPEILEEAEAELSELESRSSREEKAETEETADFATLEEALSRGIHRGVFLRQVPCVPDRTGYHILAHKVRPHIKKTTNELKKILEYRRTFTERNLRKGRLDAGALWKIQAKDPRIFCKRDEPGDIPTLAVYLLVDCSGSMKGKPMTRAREAACLLAETCDALKIPVKVTGFTGALTPDGRDVTHFEAKKFGESEKEKLAGLNEAMENRDGYSIRVAARELEARNEDQKLLIVLSDGLPVMPYNGYSGSKGLTDTARAVREAEKRGIGVIGLFFGIKKFLPNAQMIYNHCVFVDKIDTLPLQAARVLKRVISRL